MIIVRHCDLTWMSGYNGGLLCDVQFRTSKCLPPLHYVDEAVSVMQLQVFFNHPHDVCRQSIIFTTTTAGASRFPQGPEGSNLVIFKLPKYYTDEDLAKKFRPFGNLIAAKIIRCRSTNISKGFGFVSYDNPQSAEYGIINTNGLKIGKTFLKVKLSKPKFSTAYRNNNWSWQYYKT